MSRANSPRLSLCLVCAAGVAALLSGCNSRVIARERPALVADAGQGWQLVLESPAASAYASADRPELTRRDGSLNLVTAADRLRAERWPQPTRATLERRRRVYFSEDARYQTYFLRPRGTRR